MNISQFWTTKVNETMMRQRITHSSAWNSTARIYPDAAILMRACGQTRETVQFFNSKLPAPGAAKITAESRIQFANAVQEEMKRTGCNYGTASNRVHGKNPSAKFVDVVLPGRRFQFANAGDKSASTDGVPDLTPELRGIFRLPPNTTSSEWAVVWNEKLKMGQGTTMINFGKVFDALCELAQKEKSLDYESALRATKSRFSDLWDTVTALSQMPV